MISSSPKISVDLSIVIGDILIDSERTFSLTCRAMIVARPLKFETSDRFAYMIYH